MSGEMKPVAKCLMAVLIALGLGALSAHGGLLHTFLNPGPAGLGMFGYSVAAVGKNVLVGAIYDYTTATNQGAAYLFDGTTGALLKTFQKPTPGIWPFFGISVAGVGDNVLVGAYCDDTAGPDAGAAYLFDATTGSLLKTFLNPTPAAEDSFGCSVAGVGNNVLVGACGDDAGAENAGAAYLFDGTTGALLKTFQKPTPVFCDYFGSSVAGVGNNVLVGAPRDRPGAADAGAAYLFDGTTGALLKTFLNPTPAAGDGFGGSVAGIGSNVLVGACGDDAGGTNAGAAYLFDGTTGALLHTFQKPTPAADDVFGSSVAGVGNNVLVGASRDDTASENGGAAYLFDGTTGSLLKTFLSPTPAEGDSFGCSVAGVGNNVLVGDWGDDTAWNGAGAAYLFEGVGEHVIDGVPDYRWNYGCSPTSGGIVVGYWDRRPGFEGLVPAGEMPLWDGAGRDGDADDRHDSAPADRVDGAGDTFRQGTRPGGFVGYNLVDKVIASEGHVTDFWWGDDDGHDDPGNVGLDPCDAAPVPWASHGLNCIGDFMFTSQSVLADLADGYTDIGGIAPGLEHFADYSAEEGVPRFIARFDGTPTFLELKQHIDKAWPVIVSILWPFDAHSLVAYGYMEDATGEWMAVRDTWQNNTPSLAVGLSGWWAADQKLVGEHEWWKWNNRNFWVTSMVVLHPADETPPGAELFSDGFDKDASEVWGLGYDVDPGSGNGTATIVSSPLGGGNDVLKFWQPDEGSFVAIMQEICVAELTGISFDYLFDSDGKITVELDDILLAELICPLSGPGSVGADSFALFSGIFSMSELGLDPYDMHTLRIELSAPGDPVCYLDNLRVWNAIPEPASLVLLAGGLLVVLRRRKGR